MDINDLKQQIAAIEASIKAKQQDIDSFELDPDNYEDQYNNCLDSEGPVYIAGLEYDVSYALKELDPTAYRCGLADYVDSLDKEDDEDYQALTSELEELEQELEELEQELEELEQELEEEGD